MLDDLMLPGLLICLSSIYTVLTNVNTTKELLPLTRFKPITSTSRGLHSNPQPKSIFTTKQLLFNGC